MSWLQIGCPHCPSEMSVPAFMADRSTSCDTCGRAFRVPLPTRPILAGESPLSPVSILMTPGMRGNKAEGLSPIAQLPPMATVEGYRDVRPIASPEFSESAELSGLSGESIPMSAAEMFRTVSSEPMDRRAADIESEDDDDLAAAQRRLRREQFRAYRNMAMAGIGMTIMVGTLYFFLRPRN